MYRIFHNTSFDFIKWWRIAAIATIAFIVLGVASIWLIHATLFPDS